MKKVFEIECPDDTGDIWLNASTIHNTLGNYTSAMVVDISEEVTKLRRIVAALFDESDTRIPKDLDKESDEYVFWESSHNTALAELTKALQDVGYRE